MNEKSRLIVWAIMILLMATGCAMPLKMEAPQSADLSNLRTYHRTAGLYLPQELKSYQYEVVTSPLDKMVYPLGDQTAQVFKQCSTRLFDKVVMMDSMTPSQPVDVILKPSIVNFSAKVPMPAYNPYTATMVYRLEILKPSGEKVFVQTATGNAQTSKGMLSGFSARGICAEVAQKAMVDAAKQIMEGVAEADELKFLR